MSPYLHLDAVRRFSQADEPRPRANAAAGIGAATHPEDPNRLRIRARVAEKRHDPARRGMEERSDLGFEWEPPKIAIRVTIRLPRSLKREQKWRDIGTCEGSFEFAG